MDSDFDFMKTFSAKIVHINSSLLLLALTVLSVVLTTCTRENTDTTQTAPVAPTANTEANNSVVTDEATPAQVKVTEPETDPEDGIQLRLRFFETDVIKRAISAEIKIKSQNRGGNEINENLKIDLTLTAKTLESEGDKAKLEITSSSIKVYSGEQTVGETPEETTLLTIDDKSRLASESLNVGQRIHGILFIPFPEKRVKKGSIWSSETMREMPLIGTVHLKETYKFLGETKIDGKNIWKIEIFSKDESKNLEIKGVYFFDAKTGWLLRANATQKMASEIMDKQDKPMPVNVEMKMEIRPI